METLKTNYKDDIIASGTSRKYAKTSNSDGTISLTDKTNYSQVGDAFGANDINKTNKNINQLNHVTEIILTAVGWTGSAPPYVQTVNVSGIRADDEPILVSLLKDGASLDVQKAYGKAFGRIAMGTATTSNGSVTFKVYKKPETDITVGLKGV